MKIRKVQAFGATLCASVVATASADVIFDNIGAMDGSDMVIGNMHASQDFEDAYNVYDIACFNFLMSPSAGWSRIMTPLI